MTIRLPCSVAVVIWFMRPQKDRKLYQPPAEAERKRTQEALDEQTPRYQVRKLEDGMLYPELGSPPSGSPEPIGETAQMLRSLLRDKPPSGSPTAAPCTCHAPLMLARDGEPTCKVHRLIRAEKDG